MSSITAQITVGSAHPNHGGICPTHILYLHENSKPVWELMEHPRMHSKYGKPHSVRWIPSSVKSILEDALLMIGIYVFKDEPLISMFENAFPDRKGIVNICLAGDAALEKMRIQCRKIEYDYKLFISIFEGSTIRNNLKVLEQYSMDLEVMMPVYSRHFSHWTKETVVKGELP